MSVDAAKNRLNRQPGESATGYVQPNDVKLSYEDLQAAWQADIAASSSTAITGEPNGVVTGSPGDVVRQSDSVWGITSWIKQSGAATDTGWVMRDADPVTTGVTYANLAQWRAALSSGSARVVWIGNSDIYGKGPSGRETNAAPFRLALDLDAVFARARQYMEPVNAAAVGLIGGYGRSYMSVTGGWVEKSNVGIGGAGTIKCDPAVAGVFTYTHPDCEFFDLAYLSYNNTFDVAVDGGTAVTVTGSNTDATLVERIDCGGAGAHTLTVSNVQGVHELELLAVGGGVPDGVLVSNYGVASDVTDWVKDGTQYWASKTTLVGSQPADLYVISLAGNGEASASAYETAMTDLIGHLKANTNADVVLSGPLDFAYDDQDNAPWRAKASAVSAALGVPFIDFVRAAGGAPEQYRTGSYYDSDAHRLWAGAVRETITEL